MRRANLPETGDTIQYGGHLRTVYLVKKYRLFADVYFDAHPQDGIRSMRVALDDDDWTATNSISAAVYTQAAARVRAVSEPF